MPGHSPLQKHEVSRFLFGVDDCSKRQREGAVDIRNVAAGAGETVLLADAAFGFAVGVKTAFDIGWIVGAFIVHGETV